VTELELELLSDADMLLMVEKGIRGRISTDMEKQIIPTWRKNTIQIYRQNTVYGWAMSKPYQNMDLNG